MTIQAPSYTWSHLNRFISKSARAAEDEQETNYWQSAGKSSKLLARLINETFLSLPIINCQDFSPPKSGYGKAKTTLDNEPYLYDICFVDWSQAKLVQNSFLDSKGWLTPENHEILPQKEFMLTNFTDSMNNEQERFLKLRNSNQFSAPSHISTTTSQVASKCLSNDSNLIGLGYLSISSLLSLCGILVNLFIILIIIFNARQNRQSIIRNSNLGKNNLLLLQLTVTGLILSGYVFIDNMDSFNRSIYYKEKFSQDTQEHDSGSLSDYSTLSNPSIPLLTFLPPTPFHWRHYNQHQIDNDSIIIHQPQTSVEQPDSFDKNELDFIQVNQVKEVNTNRNAAIVLRYYKVDSNKKPINERSLKQNTLYLIDSQSKVRDISGAIDLFDQSLDSISLVDTACNEVTLNELNSLEIDNSVGNNNPKISAIKFLESIVFPLLIDVIASLHVWAVVALAYDRYRAIAHPLQYLRHINTSRSRSFFILSWAISLTFNLLAPMLTSHLLESIYNNEGNSSQINHRQQSFLFNQWYSEMFQDINRISINQELERSNKLAEQNAKFILANNNNLIKSHEIKTLKKCKLPLSIPQRNANSLANFITLNKNERNWLNYFERYTGKKIHGGDELPVTASEFGSMLLELSSKLSSIESFSSQPIALDKENRFNRRLGTIILLAYSSIGIIFIILVPLITITICNIRIYRIVKVHERRLSFSSGSNNGGSATVTNVINYNNRVQSRKGKSRLDYESFSLSSILEKLVSFSFLRDINQPDSPSTSCLDININLQDCPSEEALKIDNKPHSLAKNTNNNNSGNIVNRSKRTPITRRDSYQILANLMINHHPPLKADSLMQQQPKPNNSWKSCQSTISSPIHQVKQAHNHNQHQAIKRKTSDHGVGYMIRRENQGGSSSSCSTPFGNMREQLGKSNSALDWHSAQSDCSAHNGIDYSKSSGGLFNQIKMAGLSFAGVPLQEPLSSSHTIRRALHRSSSCSLTNLASSSNKLPQYTYFQSKFHHDSKQNSSCGCIQRRDNYESSTLESASLLTISQRKTCVSLNNNSNFLDDSSNGNNNKFITRLLDEDSDSMNHNLHLSQSNQQNRFPFFIGTKSASFNIVIWLIVTLLIFIIPHYILITFTQIYNLSLPSKQFTSEQNDFDRYKQKLINLFRYIFENDKYQPDILNEKDSSGGANNNQDFLIQLSSKWLSCICRILYLCMIPLNGCLYGISSRSLRETLRMILKRYISRRQASIEINHRQRSISSIRSRESSITNLPPVYYNHNLANGSRINCNHYKNMERQEKNFKRCSSYTKNMDQDQRNLERYPCDEIQSRRFSAYSLGTFEEDLKNSQNNDYKSPISNQPSGFIVGDHSFKIDCTPIVRKVAIYNNNSKLNRNASSSASLAESTKSLASTSISSTNSLINTPFDGTRNELMEKLDCLAKKQQVLPSRRQSEIQTSNVYHRQVRSTTRSANEHLDLAMSAAHHLQYSDDDIRLQVGKAVNKVDLYKQSEDSINSSEFRFFVTSADQKQKSKQHITSINLPSDPSNNYLTSQGDLSSNDSKNNISNVKSELSAKSSETFWNQVKQNLGEILLNASAQLLSIGLLENKRNHYSLSHRDSVTFKSDSAPEEKGVYIDDPCRVALLRRNSLDCLSRSHNSLPAVNPDDASKHHSSNSCRIHMLSSLNSISDSQLVNKTNQSKGCNYGILDSTYKPHTNQPITFLKPPNFLKLNQYDPSEQTNSYQISSALSPIKECSATHSYASSQSSLNNVNQQQNLQQALQVHPITCAQPFQNSTSTTINIGCESDTVTDEVFHF